MIEQESLYGREDRMFRVRAIRTVVKRIATSLTSVLRLAVDEMLNLRSASTTRKALALGLSFGCYLVGAAQYGDFEYEDHDAWIAITGYLGAGGDVAIAECLFRCPWRQSCGVCRPVRPLRRPAFVTTL